MTVLMALSLIAVKQTKAMEKNNGMMHPIIGLHLWQLEHKGPILLIGHDFKHTFGCVVYLTAAMRVGIFSWDGCQKMGNPFV